MQGKVALVTGAATGIGRATALLLARQGCDIVVSFGQSGTRAEETADAVRAHDVRTLIVKADVTRATEVDALFKRVHGAFGRVDFLVNAAGDLVERRPTGATDAQLWDRVLAVNARGTFLCCVAALRDMAKRERGKIVNISAAWVEDHGYPAAYAAAKAAVDGMTVALAREYAPLGITVNAVAPGVVDTPFHRKNTEPELFDELARATARGHAGTADEVAGVVAQLLSPAGDGVTGAVIPVCAGWPSFHSPFGPPIEGGD